MDSTTDPPDLELSPRERVALRARDRGALERFYEVYFDRIYGYVRRLLKEEHLAEDVTQDIFMHVHRALDSYDPERELRPWMFTIATNKVRDYWRSRRFADGQREVAADDGEGASYGAAPAVSHHPGPPEALEGAELTARVAEAVAELPETARTTFVLRYYEELSFEEIGRLVERNEVAVRKRYSRALEELRQRLAPEVEGLEA